MNRLIGMTPARIHGESHDNLTVEYRTWNSMRARCLDRIDNSKGYEPGNTRWATPSEQARNKRTTVRVDGVAVVDLAEQRGISSHTVCGRLRIGWSLERALSTPVQSYRYINRQHPKEK